MVLEFSGMTRAGRRTSLAWQTLTVLVTTMLLTMTAAAQEDVKPEVKPVPKPDTVAVFELDGTVADKPVSEDPLFGAIGGSDLRTLCQRIEKAAGDDKVAAVVLLLASPSIDSAQLEELRQSISRVRAKKPVYAHADSLTTGSYALLSSASRLSVAPTGDVWVNGLYGEQVYLRGLLDLIGAQPDFLTCGDYKSAAEMFMRKESSPAAAEMHNWLFDSLYASVQKMIADGRKVERAQAQQWLEQGMFTAESAAAAKLIDVVETREQLLAHLKAEHGSTIKLNKKYAKDSASSVDPNNPLAVLQLFAELMSGPPSSRITKNTVAIVHVDGAISLGKAEPSLLGAAEGAYSEEIRKALDSVADEPRIRAVVLRVNSPGGSATASEIILQAVRNVQTRKPVIVSMGGVAGSGGYYVSCRGDRIFADATTLTGSIGVVAGKLATNTMWNRVGINFEPIRRGKRAGMLSSSEPWTAEEKAELQKWMDEIYGVFQKHVEEGRKGKLAKPIAELAGGRVFTGQQALELGLVDQIGTLDDAVKYAAEKVDLKDYEVRSYPKATNIIEQLAEELNAAKPGDDKRLSLGIWESVAPLMAEIDPPRVRMVREALLQLDLMKQEKVMLTMPVLRVFDSN